MATGMGSGAGVGLATRGLGGVGDGFGGAGLGGGGAGGVGGAGGAGGWGVRNSLKTSAGMMISAALRIRPDCKAHSAATCRVTTDSAITALRLSPVDGA